MALWRTVPIVLLTLRQFLAGRTVRVFGALALLPALFALVYLFGPHDLPPYRFLATQFRELVLPTLLPIAVLLVATAAFGNEIEDRTLPYLTMKPLARWRIVLEKWVAVLLVALPMMLVGVAVTTLVAGRGPTDTASRVATTANLWPLFGAMAAGTAVATLLLASVFLLVSLVAPRALLAGVIYVFAWESLLGRFLPGVQNVSIRHAAESVFVAVLADPRVTLNEAATLRGALVTTAVVSLGALVLATFRLRTMNQE